MFKSAEEAEQPQGVSIPSEFLARADRKIQISVALVVFILFCVAYKGVVSKSFLGDDHVHLIWLRQAVLDPSLVLRNFYSNWLYPSTTPQCYRPMISVFMFTDYLLWHHNAVGFHITNFLFHETEVGAWNKLPLNKKCSIIQGSERIKNLKDDAGWTVSAGSTPILLVLNYQKLQPSSIEFLQVDRSSNGSGNGSGDGVNSSSGAKPISLLVSNAFITTQCLSATVLPVSSLAASSRHQEEKILFTLRSIPGWFSTNDKSSMVLVIPPGWTGSFDLTIKENSSILPRLKRVSKAKDVSSQSAQTLSFDVSKVPGATNASLQISRKNECFRSQCTFDFDDEHSGKLLPLSGVQSKVELKYDDLNGDGQYQVRCWALNAAHKRVGVSSDYLFITAQKAAL